MNLGAKKVAVLGIPPVGCVPIQRSPAGGQTRDCVADRNQLAQLCNSKLKREMQSLASKNQETKLIYVDNYSPLLDIIQNPEKFGKTQIMYRRRKQTIIYICLVMLALVLCGLATRIQVMHVVPFSYSPNNYFLHKSIKSRMSRHQH